MRTVLLAALLGLVLPRPALGWGCQGHRIVALIALAHLEPGVAARVNQILTADPIPAIGSRACARDASLPPIAAVANWADLTRTPATEPLHFVNLPLSARREHFDYDRLCQDDCVTSAITADRQQLRGGRDAAARGAALRNLIHFVADVHQPLHAADNDDQGGNCIAAQGDGLPRGESLHGAWDTGLLVTLMHGDDAAAYAAQLDREFGRRFAGGSQNPVDWAWESHDLAVRYTYDSLPVMAGCQHPRQQVRLDAAYIRQARPVVEAQLDRAGLRLAAILNSALGASSL